MNLLITNDDGYEALGINVLAKELAKNHTVYVLAPSTNRSAVSHCLSVHNSLEVKKVADNVWTCSGFPADCVSIALQSSLFKDVKFDCVISGINKGPNLGTDIIFSSPSTKNLLSIEPNFTPQIIYFFLVFFGTTIIVSPLDSFSIYTFSFTFRL